MHRTTHSQGTSVVKLEPRRSRRKRGVRECFSTVPNPEPGPPLGDDRIEKNARRRKRLIKRGRTYRRFFTTPSKPICLSQLSLQGAAAMKVSETNGRAFGKSVSRACEEPKARRRPSSRSLKRLMRVCVGRASQQCSGQEPRGEICLTLESRFDHSAGAASRPHAS